MKVGDLRRCVTGNVRSYGYPPHSGIIGGIVAIRPKRILVSFPTSSGNQIRRWVSPRVWKEVE